MKLALLGYHISHSLSPQIYKELLGNGISYELLDIADKNKIPSLTELSQKFDGINVTAPYKEFFFEEVIVEDPLVKKLKAINTIAFREGRAVATNTDLIAVRMILEDFSKQFPHLNMVLLGNGVMARLTLLVAEELQIPCRQIARSLGDEIEYLDLRPFENEHFQTIIVNSCSRDFSFKGILSPSFIFWDYNYKFLPHESTLPSLVKSYIDGQEMLVLQAKAAIKFWK